MIRCHCSAMMVMNNNNNTAQLSQYMRRNDDKVLRFTINVLNE